MLTGLDLVDFDAFEDCSGHGVGEECQIDILGDCFEIGLWLLSNLLIFRENPFHRPKNLSQLLNLKLHLLNNLLNR